MRRIRGRLGTAGLFVAAVVALLGLSGCEPEPPSPSDAGVPQSPPANANQACTISSTTAGAISNQYVITVAQRIVNRRGRFDRETLRDEPYRSSIVWSTPSRLDPAEVMKILGVNGDESSGRDRVEAFLAGVDDNDDGTIVGYAGVREESRPLTVTCVEGQKLTGVIKAWTDSEIGAVGCAEKPRVDAPRLAVMAYEYCFLNAPIE